MIADRLLRSFFPVITVKDIVRLYERDDIVIQHIVLDNDFLYTINAPVESDPFFLAYGREFVITDKRFIGKTADNDPALLLSLIDNV
jgi:hypothetical protein